MTYERIDKRKARKMYNAGQEVGIIPCKCNPASIWFNGFTMINDPSQEETRDFDSYVNEFEYFNCNAEMGRYAAFYLYKEENNDD